jgi:hypothetical protein
VRDDPLDLSAVLRDGRQLRLLDPQVVAREVQKNLDVIPAGALDVGVGLRELVLVLHDVPGDEVANDLELAGLEERLVEHGRLLVADADADARLGAGARGHEHEGGQKAGEGQGEGFFHREPERPGSRGSCGSERNAGCHAHRRTPRSRSVGAVRPPG